MTGSFRTADLRIGATGCVVQGRLQSRAQVFHRLGIRVGGNDNDLASHQCASPEWQIDGGAVPVVQADETAGRHREWHDRPSRFARQHNDAETGDPQALGYVVTQRRAITLFKRARHLLERSDAAFTMTY